MSRPMTGRNLRWNSTVYPSGFKRLRRDCVAVSKPPRHYITGSTANRYCEWASKNSHSRRSTPGSRVKKRVTCLPKGPDAKRGVSREEHVPKRSDGAAPPELTKAVSCEPPYNLLVVGPVAPAVNGSAPLDRWHLRPPPFRRVLPLSRAATMHKAERERKQGNGSADLRREEMTQLTRFLVRLLGLALGLRRRG
jgi:hypothetical protein